MALEDKILDTGIVGKSRDKFFDLASPYIPNKYVVCLYGEYVDKAVQKMASDIESNTNTTLKNIYRNNFETWKNTHYDKDGKFIDLVWTCQSVNIPSAGAETEDGDYTLDTTKGIKYPLIKSHVKIQTLAMKIMEDRKLMMYQFFNALQNQFHNPLMLKPRSSFHKMSILIVAMTQNEGIVTVDERTTPDSNSDSYKELRKLVNTDIKSIPGQAYEFNSAVLNNVEQLSLSNKTKGPLEYSVSFKVPNTFQKSFNTGISGLRDSTSDRNNLTDAATDSKVVSGTINDINKVKYNKNALEIDSNTNKKFIRDR